MEDTGNLRIAFLDAARHDEARSFLVEQFKVVWDGPLRLFMRLALVNTPLRPVFLAAVVDDKIVGTIACASKDARSRLYELSNLAVDPAWRRQGLGHELLRQAEKFISETWLHGEAGHITLTDSTKLADKNSHFYEDAGYAPENPPRYDRDMPVLVKILGPAAEDLAGKGPLLS